MTCLYFAAEKSPLGEPLLVLNGEGQGLVNSLTVPSLVAPSYAPEGLSLVAATVIGNPPEADGELETGVRLQLKSWFGPSVMKWRHLRTYRIPHALPAQVPPLPDPLSPVQEIRPGIFACGEYRHPASLHWAMVSGRKTGEAVVKKIRR